MTKAHVKPQAHPPTPPKLFVAGVNPFLPWIPRDTGFGQPGPAGPSHDKPSDIVADARGPGGRERGMPSVVPRPPSSLGLSHRRRRMRTRPAVDDGLSFCLVCSFLSPPPPPPAVRVTRPTSSRSRACMLSATELSDPIPCPALKCSNVWLWPVPASWAVVGLAGWPGSFSYFGRARDWLVAVQVTTQVFFFRNQTSPLRCS